MRKNKLAITALLLVASLSLSGCASLFELLLSGNNNNNEQETTYVDHFVNSEGKTIYIKLNFNEKTLLPSMTDQIRLDLVEEGEEPDFSGIWSGMTFTSKNPDVVSVDNKGNITALKVGNARIDIKIMSCTVYVDISVIAKELDYVTIKNARKTFIKDKTFVPSFNLIGTLKGGFTEEITEYSVDSSEVNMHVEGDYTVTVSGEYLETPFETSYDVSVIDAVSYSPKSLDYNYMDLLNQTPWTEDNGRYMPNSGSIKSLVIPVWFANSSSMISDRDMVREKLNIAFNGAHQENGWNSVKTYYYELSNHTLNYNATIANWYEVGQSFSYYDDNSTNKKQLVLNAVDWYFTNNPSDSRSSYDSDHNGVFDSICILYGSNESDTGMVRFENYSNATDSDHPGVKYHMWASVFEALDDTNHSDADSHVFIHETGHMLGLMDYYDYGGDTRPAGGFNMQEHTTGSHEAFSITALGWGKVIVPETDTVIELEDYESSHVAILLSNHPETHNSPFDEYMLLELFAPTGTKKFDATYKWKGFYSNGPQEAGVRLWHVDARLTQYGSSGYGTNLVTDPTLGRVTEAFTNTSTGTNHGSKLGEEYNRYSILFNVRNNAPEEDSLGNKIKVINETHLFRSGDSFNWNDFTNQFPDGNKMDCGETFSWQFSVDSISTVDGKAVATISIERI